MHVTCNKDTVKCKIRRYHICFFIFIFSLLLNDKWCSVRLALGVAEWRNPFLFCLDFLCIISQVCYLDQSAVIDYRFLSQCEKVITFQPFVHVSWQSWCLYLALSVTHSICTVISCSVSFSHMPPQPLSSGLLPSIPSIMLMCTAFDPDAQICRLWEADGQSHHWLHVCLLHRGKVEKRTWNEMRGHE